jgi:hypothetical protein
MENKYGPKQNIHDRILNAQIAIKALKVYLQVNQAKIICVFPTISLRALLK